MEKTLYEQAPIGLKPKWLWDTTRIDQIEAAIKRYQDVHKSIPEEWLIELGELQVSVVRHNHKSRMSDIRRAEALKEYDKA